MDNPPHPRPSRTREEVIDSLDRRVSVLEQQLSGSSPDAAAGEGTEEAGAAGPGSPSAGTGSLAASLAAQGDKLRDLEVGLVGRIADVDDDRRRTAASLQRAMDTHLEEVETRLRRQGRWTVALVVLAVLLVPVASWLVLRQMPGVEPEVTEDLTGLRREVARLSAEEGGLGALQERVAAVTASVNEVAESLERLGTEQAAGMEAAFERERGERQAAHSRLEQRLGRLEAAQERLAGQMDMQRSAPREGRATGPEGKPSEGMPPAAAAVEPAAALASQGKAQAPVDSQGDAVTVAEQNHALQLIGFFSLDELRRFSDRSDLPARVYYREESLRGRPWYVLIHSLHEDYDAAADERTRLPPELAALDVWIRPLPQGSRLQVLGSAADRRRPAN